MTASPGAASAPYTLVIGTKNWSSWSLRPWLLMSEAAIPFVEIEIALREPGSPAAIARHSPSGFVPALKLPEGAVIWDSLAIAETLAERHPEKKLWPADPADRATARAVSAEMHAGFASLRREMPMDILGRYPPQPPSPETARDIARITALWRALRGQHTAQGAFLFGAFSIADAFYAPVVTRFETYGVKLGAVERDYAEAIGSLPGMRAWRAACAEWARLRE